MDGAAILDRLDDEAFDRGDVDVGPPRTAAASAAGNFPPRGP